MRSPSTSCLKLHEAARSCLTSMDNSALTAHRHSPSLEPLQVHQLLCQATILDERCGHIERALRECFFLVDFKVSTYLVRAPKQNIHDQNLQEKKLVSPMAEILKKLLRGVLQNKRFPNSPLATTAFFRTARTEKTSTKLRQNSSAHLHLSWISSPNRSEAGRRKIVPYPTVFLNTAYPPPPRILPTLLPCDSCDSMMLRI